MHFHTFLLASLICLRSSTAESRGCPRPWKEATSGCYLFLEEPLSWPEAQERCEQQRAHLAEVASQGEQDYLKSENRKRSSSVSSFWIGLTDEAREGTWVWASTGKVANFTQWDKDRPVNNSKTENCARIWHNGNWDDQDCSANFDKVNAIGAICELVQDTETQSSTEKPTKKVTPSAKKDNEEAVPWTKVFSHDASGGLFSNASEALLKNPGNESAKLFSILHHLESFRLTDGRFHLKLCYPQLTSFEPPCNEWSQTSNPATDSIITGFQPVQLTFSRNSYSESFGGLGLSPASPNTLIDDAPSRSNSHCAIGAYQFYLGEGNIPGPKDVTKVQKVKLFAETPSPPGPPGPPGGVSTEVAVLAGGIGVGVLLILILLVVMARRARDWLMVEENSDYGTYSRGYDGEGEYGDGDVQEVIDTNDYYA